MASSSAAFNLLASSSSVDALLIACSCPIIFDTVLIDSNPFCIFSELELELKFNFILFIILEATRSANILVALLISSGFISFIGISTNSLFEELIFSATTGGASEFSTESVSSTTGGASEFSTESASSTTGGASEFSAESASSTTGGASEFSAESASSTTGGASEFSAESVSSTTGGASEFSAESASSTTGGASTISESFSTNLGTISSSFPSPPPNLNFFKDLLAKLFLLFLLNV